MIASERRPGGASYTREIVPVGGEARSGESAFALALARGGEVGRP
jgi:hypothetical protein